jgi:hypothetical protein
MVGLAGWTSDGPGTPNSMRLDTPRGLSVDGSGNLYIADRCNHRVWIVDPGGNSVVDGDGAETMTARAGSGATGCGGGGGGDFAGDGGQATSARLNEPTGVHVEGTTLYIADSCNQRVRRVTVAGTISTFAGSSAVPAGTAACSAGGYADGGGVPTAAVLNRPEGVTASGGTVYIAEAGNHIVRQVNGGAISLTAGMPATSGYADGGAASAQFAGPRAVAVDPGGVLVADEGNHRLRRVEAGDVTSVGGTGGPEFCGDNHAAIDTSCLNNPGGLTATASGELYIMDGGNNRVRHIDVATSSIRTVAGNGSGTYCGDGGAAGPRWRRAWRDRPTRRLDRAVCCT